MLIRYLVDDAFLDAVDDLVTAVRDLPRTSVMGLTSTLTDLQVKRQKVQYMMDDGFETPTEGKIIFNGEDITGKSITERANLGISFAFQQPARFKGITVLDLLRIAAGKQLTVSACCEFLSEVGLCARDYINREVNASLSGGELKRIEIATVLARGTQLAIFDEPEAGIDLWSFQNLISVFERMRTANTRSILIISHQERILQIADEIVVLANGQVTKHGPREEILPELLGTSDAVGVCGCLKRGGANCD